MSPNEPELPSHGAAEIAHMRDDIANTRAEMSANIEALESQLNPKELREKALVELAHVEARVKEAVREQLLEAGSLIKSEIAQVKETVKADLILAKDSVKRELNTAVHNAKQSVRDATLGQVENLATKAGDVMNEARDTLVDTIRQNPLPATLAGIGLAWLLMNRSTSSSRRDRERMYGRGNSPRGNGGYGPSQGRPNYSPMAKAGQIVTSAGAALGGVTHSVVDAAAGAAHGVAETATQIGAHSAETAGAWAHQATDAAGTLVHQASDAAGTLMHQASDAVGQLAHQAHDAAGYVAEGARSQGRRFEQGFQGTLENNPVALGAAALAVGAAFGFALPRTHREDEWMGAASDQVTHRVQEKAHEALHAVQHLSDQAAQKASDAVHQAVK